MTAQVDTAYSKREQDMFLQSIASSLDDHKKQLNRIEEQTLKTNGRVTKLETQKTLFISFISFLIGCFIFGFPHITRLLRAEIYNISYAAGKEGLRDELKRYEIELLNN